MAFFKDKVARKQVNFSELVENKEKLVILFPKDELEQYKLLKMCAGWKDHFQRFIFVMPDKGSDFYKNLVTFKQLEVCSYRETGINYHNAIIFDFSRIKNNLNIFNSAQNSIISTPENIGNIRFLPPVNGADEFIQKFCDFFQIELSEGELFYDFKDLDTTLHDNEFYSNKFMNFTINVEKEFPIEKIKEIVVNIKQNFPANCYLVGKELKKHEFINFKNLMPKDLISLYKIGINSDIFLNTSETTARIFSGTEIKQIYIGRIPLTEKTSYINPVNLTNLHNKISSLLEKE